MTEQALPLQQFRAMGCDISVVLSMPSGAQAQALLADGAVAATFAGRYVAIAKTAAAAG